HPAVVRGQPGCGAGQRAAGLRTLAGHGQDAQVVPLLGMTVRSRSAKHTRRNGIGPELRHRRTMLSLLLAALVVLVGVFWPVDETRFQVVGLGVVAVLSAAVGVPYLTDRRNPVFRSRDEVERVLGLPVLASYPAPRER